MSSVTCVSCKTKAHVSNCLYRVVCKSCRKSPLKTSVWRSSLALLLRKDYTCLYYYTEASRLFLTFMHAWLLERRYLGKSDRPNIRCFAAVLWGSLAGVKLPPKRACGEHSAKNSCFDASVSGGEWDPGGKPVCRNFRYGSFKQIIKRDNVYRNVYNNNNNDNNKKLSYCCDSRSYCMQYFNAIHCDRNISTSE